MPKHMQDSSIYPGIRQELRTRGYSGENIQKLLSGNVTRVLQEAELVAPV